MKARIKKFFNIYMYIQEKERQEILDQIVRCIPAFCVCYFDLLESQIRRIFNYLPLTILAPIPTTRHTGHSVFSTVPSRPSSLLQSATSSLCDFEDSVVPGHTAVARCNRIPNFRR